MNLFAELLRVLMPLKPCKVQIKIKLYGILTEHRQSGRLSSDLYCTLD